VGQRKEGRINEPEIILILVGPTSWRYFGHQKGKGRKKGEKEDRGETVGEDVKEDMKGER